ncbi:hypothetical protein DFH11DRAFT_775403 [Phellopilus nigrolimitatus]|nr:hypothetical protein DFH11DRAFT_775403 [Phellopilus nigrolimitatus]
MPSIRLLIVYVPRSLLLCLFVFKLSSMLVISNFVRICLDLQIRSNLSSLFRSRTLVYPRTFVIFKAVAASSASRADAKTRLYISCMLLLMRPPRHGG